MVNDYKIDNEIVNTDEMDSTIEKFLKNMQYYNDIRFKNESNKNIFVSPDLYRPLLVFLLMIRTIDDEPTFDSNLSKQTHKVLIMKSMYKEPEKFIDNVYGLLPPNPDFDLKEFIKPSFINYVAVLNEQQLSEDIIIGNLIRFLFVQTLLLQIYSHPTKCVDKSKINLYTFKYITKQVNNNNKIKDEYIHIMADGELISSNTFRDKNILPINIMTPQMSSDMPVTTQVTTQVTTPVTTQVTTPVTTQVTTQVTTPVTTQFTNYQNNYQNFLNQMQYNIKETPKPIIPTETIVSPGLIASMEQLFSSQPSINQFSSLQPLVTSSKSKSKTKSRGLPYVSFIVFISLIILGILIFAINKIK